MKKKKGVKNEKKNGADTEMGYCPFEHKAGRVGRALGTGTLGRWASEMQARGTGGAGARHGAQHSAKGRARSATTRQPSATTRQPGAATRPAGRPRHGHCARLGVPART